MKEEFKKILFTTDLSNNCRNAFSYAATLAVKYGCGITILHVLEKGYPESLDFRIRDFLGQEAWEIMQKKHENNARSAIIGKKTEMTIVREALDTFSETSGNDGGRTTVESILIKNGDVVETILEISVEEGIDLIVLSSNKTMFTDSTSLGRNMKGVLKRSKIPVIMIPPIER